MENAPAAPTPSAVAVSPAAPPASGRLAVLTAMAVACAAIPVPFLPSRVLIRIRGAVAQDLVARHGLSLTSDAREILASPTADKGGGALLRRTVEIVTGQLLKRFGPIGAITSAARAVEVYALGLLGERYVTQLRAAGPVRIHGDEARKLRDLVDRSVLRAMHPSLSPRPTTMGGAAEDLRDEFTRWIDAVLLTGAAIPGYFERRLEAAFDEIAAEARGRGDV